MAALLFFDEVFTAFSGATGMSLIAPHGGTLVNRVLDSNRAAAATKEAATLPAITWALANEEKVRATDRQAS